MDKANTGEQPVKLYRNKETGELFHTGKCWKNGERGMKASIRWQGCISIIGIPDMTIYLNDLKEARHYVWNTWRR